MSSLNLNKVLLCGRMTADVELKQTPSGVMVCTFTLAINRRYQPKGEDGKPAPQQADFVSCVAWRQTAEFIKRHFRKGSSLCISGAIQTRSWQDQQGQKHHVMEVVAEEAMFVDSKSDGTSVLPAAPANSSHSSAVPASIDMITTPSFEKDDDLPL